MQKVSEILQNVCKCAAAEFWLQDDKLLYRWIARYQNSTSYRFRILDPKKFLDKSNFPPDKKNKPSIENLGKLMFDGHYPLNEERYIHGNLIWVENNRDEFTFDFELQDRKITLEGKVGSNYHSLVFIPLKIDAHNRGLLVIKYHQQEKYDADTALYLSTFAQTFGLAVADRRAQYSLRERVKEMTCLYNLSEISQQSYIELDKMLQSVVEMLPPAWQYPEIASARIIYDGKSYKSAEFRESPHKLISDIIVNGEKRGTVELTYISSNQELEMDVFLREERKLMETIANHLGLILERRKSHNEQEELQKQLRHADRLATIGQLAAGVAHELNEPLSSILGFAELIKSEEKLPEEIDTDLQRIIDSAIHAREVVKKMLVFAREVPVQKICSNINSVIEDGLYFLNSRCQKEGIKLTKNLAQNLPRVTIDNGQIHQILVNLVVNAIQAIEKPSGEIAIKTYSDSEYVILEISDNGCGMTDEIKEKIFLPFFTTKDVGQGTGLGLPVVYGIISSIGGDICVDSKPGKGTIFAVKIPICKEINDER